jgi:asparagine synthase (glutamine-hydrolysing)
MLASLEVRVPYLDELLLDRILPLRAEKKIVKRQLKALLQPLARRLLPREVWDRPKHGFNVPVEMKLAGSWNPVVEEALVWGEHNLKIFNYPYLRRLHRISRKECGIGLELWNPVMLITWAKSQPVQWSNA